MCLGGGKCLLHILGDHIAATLQLRHRLGHSHQSQCGTGRCAPQKPVVGAGRLNQFYCVGSDFFTDKGVLHCLPQSHQLLGGDHRLDRAHRVYTLPLTHHKDLIFGTGIAKTQPDHKPVDLAVRQQLGTGSAGGVLGCNDGKGLR